MQGAFGALLAPAALSLLSTTFVDRESRIRAFAVFGAVSSAGGAVGLLLGGVLTEWFSWHWCLFVNVPIAAIVLGGLRIISSDTERAPGRIDIGGAVTSVLGLIGLVFGFANAESQGWGASSTLVPIIVGVALLAIFVLVERRASDPLMPLRVLADRNRGTANIAALLVNAGLFGTFLFTTYYLADVLEYSPIAIGLAFLPVVLAIVVTAALAGSPLLARFGPRVTISAGSIIAAAGLALFTRVGVGTDYATGVLPAMVIFGLGLGLVFARLADAATSGTAAGDASVASATFTTSSQIGAAIGTALLSSLAAAGVEEFLSSAAPSADIAVQATVAGFHIALWASAALYLLCAVVSVVFFRSGVVAADPDAEITLVH